MQWLFLSAKSIPLAKVLSGLAGDGGLASGQGGDQDLDRGQRRLEYGLELERRVGAGIQ
jgi:hypothetical protein